MEPATLFTMFFTLGIIWGGCAFVIILAARRERSKKAREQ
jgi:hypothetical protein